MILRDRADAAMLAALTILVAGAQGAAAQTAPTPIPPPIIAVPMLPAPVGAEASATPLGNPGEWVSSDDYPIKALREDAAGVTGFRVLIGTDGKVTGCTVTSSSGTPELDEATCRLVSLRARFSPARNAKGEPVAGNYSNRIRWTIPEGNPTYPMQIDPLATIETFIVEADGTPTHCTTTKNGVDVSNDARGNPCRAGRKFLPFVDATGRPVRRLVTVNLAVTVTDPSAKPPPRKKRRR